MRPGFLARAKQKGAPLIEDGRAIFLWQGDTPARVIGDFNHWSDGPSAEMQSFDEGLWTLALDFPNHGERTHKLFSWPDAIAKREGVSTWSRMRVCRVRSSKQAIRV